MFLLLVAGGRSILYTLSNYKPLERNTYHLIQTMTSCRTHHLPESTRPRPFTLEAPWAPYRPFARDLVPPASWCLMNGWKALETTEMSTPQKFQPPTCELWEPNRLEFRFRASWRICFQKVSPSSTQLHTISRVVCDVTASVVGLVSPLWVANVWRIVSDQYLTNDDHIYQVTRLTHQDGMLRPVKMLIFLRTLGCCFLNLGSEASTSSDLSLPLAFLAKDSTEVYPASSKTSPNMPWPFPSTPTPAKPLHHLNARHLRWVFFSSCLSAIAEGITIRQGNFGWLWRHTPFGNRKPYKHDTKHGRFSSFLSWPKGYCHQSLSFTLNPGKGKEVSEVLAY